MAPIMIILMAKLDFSFLDQSMTRTENLLKSHEDELHRVSTAYWISHRRIELTMIVAVGWCSHWVWNSIVGWSKAGARGKAIKQTNNWRRKFKRSRWKKWEGSHCWRHLASKKVTLCISHRIDVKERMIICCCLEPNHWFWIFCYSLIFNVWTMIDIPVQ